MAVTASARILQSVLQLHLSTEHPFTKRKRRGVTDRLARRMYCTPFSLYRIGRYEKRHDLTEWQLLNTYIARRIFINEKKLRGGFLLDDMYEAEVAFTTGLWKLFCFEVFGKYLAEIPLPDTYDELESVFLNKTKTNARFNITDVVLAANINSLSLDDSDPKKFKISEFNYDCRLPSSSTRNWTDLFALRSANDGRTEPGTCLVTIAIGMFIYASQGKAEPYKNFWIEHSYNAISKGIVKLESGILNKLRYGKMYEFTDDSNYPAKSVITSMDYRIHRAKKDE